MREEILPLLDDGHKVIGSAPRSLCHNGKSFLLHPVVHLHIVRGNEILLQKRSAKKRIQPGKWDTCVGGHVSMGETPEEALRREASEEIRILPEGAELIAQYVFCSAVEREFVNIHIMKVKPDFRITVSNDEVDEVRFWHVSEIINPANKELFTPNFLQEFNEFLINRYVRES